MQSSILAIQRARLSRLFSDIQGQYFSNPRLETYVREINMLFESVEKYINTNEQKIISNKIEQANINVIIDFLLTSIEYLEDSVIDIIPFETIFCLENALKDWIKEQYVIVVSFKRGAYLFSSFLSNEKLYNYIESNFGVKFTYKLIQIAIPKHEVNDYLFNVVLYHELGHFVDIKYNISSKIALSEFGHLNQFERRIKESHFAEFFADIFAAQYISKYSSLYLDYFAGDDPDSSTHPATTARSKVVNDFLNKIENEIVNTISRATLISTKIPIGIKYEPFDTQDIISLIPAEIEKTTQLHYTFIAGWELWLHERNKFPIKDNNKLYKVINNLLEKTISNYMVKSVWEAANVS